MSNPRWRAYLLLPALALSVQAAGGEDRLNVPPVGHGQFTYWDYNIWGAPSDAADGQGNCHNAADRFLVAALDRGMKAGILVCGGGSPAMDSRYHTANWLILPDKPRSAAAGRTVSSDVACIINWGDSCCWRGASLKGGALALGPPGSTSSDCALKACGDQASAETRTLPAGKFVERPGPYICALHVAGGRSDIPIDHILNNPDWSRAKAGACRACCRKRADMWDDDKKDMTGGDRALGAQWDHRKRVFLTDCDRACSHLLEYRACGR